MTTYRYSIILVFSKYLRLRLRLSLSLNGRITIRQIWIKSVKWPNGNSETKQLPNYHLAIRPIFPNLTILSDFVLSCFVTELPFDHSDSKLKLKRNLRHTECIRIDPYSQSINKQYKRIRKLIRQLFVQHA